MYLYLKQVSRAGRYTLLVFGLLAAAVFAQGSLLTTTAGAATRGVVSLTFDDSNLDQYTQALPILQQYGMHGTFFTLTGYVGVHADAMTVADLQALYNAGNEIAAHTVLHPDLTQLSSDEATREICQSRNTLLGWGFPVTDFAYPLGTTNSAVEKIVQQCGFNSARGDFSLQTPYDCKGCALAETIPPADPYDFRAAASVHDYWTLADLESLVKQAESTGGWVPIIIHHVCANDCNQYSVSPTLFSSFLAWLQTQPVSVKTVAQVIGGAVKPAVNAPQVPPAPVGTNGVVNSSLENGNPYSPGTPACWQASNSGTNSASFAETGTAHTGSVGETVTMSNYSSGDAKLLIKQDLGQCAPSVVAGDVYLTSAWYQSTVPTRFSLYYRDANGGWHYWTQSPQFAASGSWAQATWAAPAVPAAATAVSFGMNIAANGTLTTDDYSLVDTGPPSTPTVSLTAPSAGATLSGPVTFSANASSPIGISKVDFLVNGVVVATATSAPWTASWDSTTVGDGPVTVTARATDIAGNQVTTSGQADTVSNAASRGGNMLPNASLENYSGAGSVPDCWTRGGFGTNTFAWSKTSNAHSGNWAQTVTISAYTSGDRKLITPQNASACSPRVTPGSTYTLSSWYQSTATVNIVTYYKNSSGSWVYWTTSKNFAASSPWAQATYTTPAVPAGAVALSFGVALASTGSLTTDDYTMTSN